METQQATIAQRSRKKLHFQHQDMDYYLSWILGRQLYDGADTSECFGAAAHIEDGDPESWQKEWLILAERVETLAKSAVNAGDRDQARRAYLRACTYYRAPLFIMLPTSPTFLEHWHKLSACFQQAARLFEPQIERLHVSFENHLLNGYFWKVDNSGQKRPTLIVVGGLETFAEDCYFMLGQAGAARGYNVLSIDLPGQGVTPFDGLYFQARMGPAVKAVVDEALSHSETDPERLALYGFSWGGHIGLKGAQYDQRIKALIVNPAMPDVFRAVRAQQGGHLRGNPVSWIAFQQIAWRLGLRISWNPGDIARRFAKAYDYLVYGRADLSQIHCPTLCLAGEGEAKITLDIARECLARLPNPDKKLVIFTAEEGSEAHCQVDNLALPNQTIFDWLEQVFGDDGHANA